MSGLFSSPKAPVIPAPVVMPTENNSQVVQAQQKQLQAAATEGGRASTILTQQDISKTDQLGGN